MEKLNLAKALIREYGIGWFFLRGLYSAKLAAMRNIPRFDALFEKRVSKPTRLDIFAIDVDRLRTFLNALPEAEKRRLVEEADDICEGKLLAFSELRLDYGHPLNWQLNPLTGQACDVHKKWYHIPDFDKSRGDIKLIWAASRFSQFITLARAFLLTGSKKYFAEYRFQLNDWLKKNPYLFGANYKCGQECSIRVANTLLAYAVFERCGMVEPSDADDAKELVHRCYKRILNNFFYAHRCIRNDHTFSELMGMILGAWCHRDEKRLRYAYETLEKELARQFTDEGGYLSFSFNYEREILQEIECVLAAGRAAGRSLSQGSLRRLTEAAALLFQCQEDSSGYLPNYGSNDGTLVFPVTACGYRDYRPVLNTVYALAAGKRLYESGPHDEELIWFSEESAYEREAPEKRSAAYDSAGLYTLRNDRAFALLVANAFRTRPAHMDQLHLDLWINGVNVFCDAGTYSYADEAGRGYVLSNAHNTLTVAGRKQMNTYGKFLVYDWTERKDVRWEKNLFEGTIHSRNGYIHKRTVRLERDRVIVLDEIQGRPGDRYSVKYHTACRVESKTDTPACVELFDGANKLCEMESTEKWTVDPCAVSESYLSKKPAICLSTGGVLTGKTASVETTIKLT